MICFIFLVRIWCFTVLVSSSLCYHLNGLSSSVSKASPRHPSGPHSPWGTVMPCCLGDKAVHSSPRVTLLPLKHCLVPYGKQVAKTMVCLENLEVTIFSWYRCIEILYGIVWSNHWCMVTISIISRLPVFCLNHHLIEQKHFLSVLPRLF